MLLPDVSVHVHLDTCQQGADHVRTLLLQFTAVQCTGHRPEAEFVDVIGTKLLRFFLLAIHSHLYYGFYPPPPPSVLKLVCNVNVIY